MTFDGFKHGDIALFSFAGGRMDRPAGGSDNSAAGMPAGLPPFGPAGDLFDVPTFARADVRRASSHNLRAREHGPGEGAFEAFSRCLGPP